MLKDKIKITWYWVGRYACKFFCLLFFRIRSNGTENVPAHGPVLLLSNHQSYLDPVLCGITLRRRMCFVARDTLFVNSFFGALLKSLGIMPIKRGQADIAAIKLLIEKLKAGRTVVLFPEATRSQNGRIAHIKPGFGLLSRRANASVVPVLIDGAFECWPRHRSLFRPGRIFVCFGKPITPQQIKDLNDTEFAELITQTLRKMQNECRTRQGKKPYSYN